MTDPTVATVLGDHPMPEDSGDAAERTRNVGEAMAAAAEFLRDRLPRRYADAVATNPEVRGWVADVVACAVHGQNRRLVWDAPQLAASGPSLLLLGSTGTGKTFQTWGAVRALAVSGVKFTRWQVSTAADIYATMRPRHGVDSEAVFERFAHAPLLVLDDLGAAKPTEWNEEVNYRLINHRYERGLSTLITTNLGGAMLRDTLGVRVVSRINEMCRQVVLAGGDRRAAGPRPVPGVQEPKLFRPMTQPGVPMPDHVREAMDAMFARSRVEPAGRAPEPNSAAHAAAVDRARAETEAITATNDETTED
jgi:DNA replication protein DnaC